MSNKQTTRRKSALVPVGRTSVQDVSTLGKALMGCENMSFNEIKTVESKFDNNELVSNNKNLSIQDNPLGITPICHHRITSYIDSVLYPLIFVI
jgi:hypothetical protein